MLSPLPVVSSTSTNQWRVGAGACGSGGTGWPGTGSWGLDIPVRRLTGRERSSQDLLTDVHPEVLLREVVAEDHHQAALVDPHDPAVLRLAERHRWRVGAGEVQRQRGRVAVGRLLVDHGPPLILGPLDGHEPRNPVIHTPVDAPRAAAVPV